MRRVYVSEFFLKQEYRRIFFPEQFEFWIFLCCGSLTGSHLLPTWVTYKPAVITLQISNTARSKYTYVLFFLFLSFSFGGVATSEVKRDQISSDSPTGRLLNSKYRVRVSLFTVFRLSCLSSWTRQFIFPLIVMADRINFRHSVLLRRSIG